MYVLMKWIFRVIKNKNLTIKEKYKWTNYVIRGYYNGYQKRRKHRGY